MQNGLRIFEAHESEAAASIATAAADASTTPTHLILTTYSNTTITTANTFNTTTLMLIALQFQLLHPKVLLWSYMFHDYLLSGLITPSLINIHGNNC